MTTKLTIQELLAEIDKYFYPEISEKWTNSKMEWLLTDCKSTIIQLEEENKALRVEKQKHYEFGSVMDAARIRAHDEIHDLKDQISTLVTALERIARKEGLPTTDETPELKCAVYESIAEQALKQSGTDGK